MIGDFRCSQQVTQYCNEVVGDFCSHNIWTSGIQCRPPDSECAYGDCVLPNDTCPQSARSVCRGNERHECNHDRVEAVFDDCSATGRQCVPQTNADGDSEVVCQ